MIPLRTNTLPWSSDITARKVQNEYDIERECLRKFPHQTSPDALRRSAATMREEVIERRSRGETAWPDFWAQMADAKERAANDHERAISGQSLSVSQLQSALVGLTFDVGPMSKDEARIMALSIYHHGGISPSRDAYPGDAAFQNLLVQLERVLSEEPTAQRKGGLARGQRPSKSTPPLSHSVASQLRHRWRTCQEELDNYEALFRGTQNQPFPDLSGGGGRAKGIAALNRVRDSLNKRRMTRQKKLEHLRGRAGECKRRYEGYIAGTHHPNGRKRRVALPALDVAFDETSRESPCSSSR